MFTRLIVSKKSLGCEHKKRVEKHRRITRADIRPGVYGLYSPIEKKQSNLSVRSQAFCSLSSLQRWKAKPTSRDAQIAIFLADSRFFWKCDLPIFADSDFLSKNYNWQHIKTQIYANINKKIFTSNKLLKITILKILQSGLIYSFSLT